MFEARPCLVSDRTGEKIILGGNARYQAAKEIGYQEVPVIVMSGLTVEQEREVAIKDNGDFGEWDLKALAESWRDVPLEEWGVLVDIDKLIDSAEEGETIEVPQSVQLKPPMEYIMIVCEPNSVEWEELKERLKLRMVRRGGYKRGSVFDDVGLERVLKYDDFRRRVTDAYCRTE